MKIKPLEWIDGVESQWAKTEFGTYFLTVEDLDDIMYSCCFVTNVVRVSVFNWLKGSEANAKQAAEKHWQERVKRCLID